MLDPVQAIATLLSYAFNGLAEFLHLIVLQIYNVNVPIFWIAVFLLGLGFLTALRSPFAGLLVVGFLLVFLSGMV